MTGSIVKRHLAHVRLLGGLRLVSADGETIRLPTRRARGLLAIVCLEGDAGIPRDRLCGLLWSDRAEEQARASLRQCLFELKGALGDLADPLLDVDRERIALRSGVLDSDVNQIRQALAGGGEALSALPPLLSAGRLLEGLEIPGLFQDWADQSRAAFDAAIATDVTRCLERLEAEGRWREVCLVADALLHRDPLQETIAAAAIRAERASGRHGAAQQRFRATEQALADELGVAPGPTLLQALVEPPAAASRAPASAADAPTPVGARSERRHVTVLSCGLAREPDSGVDPEDWYAIAREFRSAASEATVGFGGHIERARGERLIAYFGYPDAQEDAAVRAVRAGLAIAQLKRTGVSVRVGVHAGPVVVARGDDGEAEIFGDAPDLAARVQDRAPAGAVAMTGPVHDLVSGTVAAEPLDPLEGQRPPVRLYRAVSNDASSGRGFAPRECTPFVGRDDEVRMLASRWARTRDGEGQFVLVVGEPGIGKTRLVDEFKARLRVGGHRAIHCAGAPLLASMPFHAVAEILRQGLGWRDADTPAQRFAELERALVEAELKPEEAAPLIADLLGLPIAARYAPLMLAPDQRRRRLLAALAAWVFAAARGQPLLLVAEDLHWIDPSSLELLRALVEQGATSPVMLLATARPEFEAQWPSRSHHTQITLAGLAARPMRALVDGLVARAGMADATAAAVVERANGVPLFAEELTRLILDGEGNRGPGPIEAGYIPATLRDSLAARLDRLGAGKKVAQLASVLGRTFSYDLLHAVSPLAEPDLESGLARLADAELIYVRGTAPEATYRFKHALIQDAAYATLLKADRRDLHARVAQTIAGRFAALADAEPQVMAQHWAEAGEDDKAIAAWTKAAAAAEARHAFVEAEDGYRRALAILATQPETPARDQHELDLGLALVVITTTTHGHRAAGTVERAARNKVLAERGGFVGAITGMRTLTFSQSVMAGDWVQVSAQAEQMRAFSAGVRPGADRKGWRYALAMSHFTQFNAAYYRGFLPEAEAHYQRWLEFHEGGDFDQRMTTTPALCNAAHLACHLGQPDLARARGERAQVWARQTGVAYEEAFAQALDALLQVFMRDVDRAEALGAAATAVAEEKGFLHVAGWARAALGWARAQRGATREGVDLIRASIAGLGAVQFRVSLPLFMTLLGEAQALDGTVDEALASFEGALNVNPDERIYRPQTLICRGELRARMGQVELAEADFRHAIALARTMSAAGYEPRAANGLAQLLGARDAAGARDMLVSPIKTAAASETAHRGEARALG